MHYLACCIMSIAVEGTHMLADFIQGLEFLQYTGGGVEGLLPQAQGLTRCRSRSCRGWCSLRGHLNGKQVEGEKSVSRCFLAFQSCEACAHC